ncbi:hypothetical protein AAHZ94_31925, partial [Streptomyces sp. HSW2009]
MTTSRDRAGHGARETGRGEGGGRGAPRTLAEELRGRPDGALAHLLRARPDLLNPVPGDLTQLATRAGTRASVVRAVERLDRFALQTAEALAVAPDPCPYETLLALMTGDAVVAGDAVVTGDAAVAGGAPAGGGEASGTDGAFGGSGASGADGAGGASGGVGAEGVSGAVGAAGVSGAGGKLASHEAGGRSASAADEAGGGLASTAGGPRTAPTSTPQASADDVRLALPHAVATLRQQALVWGGDERLRLVRTARELLAPAATRPSPTGLGPTVAEATAGMSPGRLQEIIATAGLPATPDPVTATAALSGLFADRTRMAALLAQAPPAALGALRKLMWGPPYGAVSAATADASATTTDGPGGTGSGTGAAAGGAGGSADAHAADAAQDDREGRDGRDGSGPAPHLHWLLARGLLLPAGPRNVVLPREVALHLRGGRAHRVVEPTPPPLAPLTERRPQVVDNAAAGQAYTALATVEELLAQWQSGGPAVLRAGGLSVRDLKRTAVALDVPEPMAAFWIELAYAAGLLASDGEADERFAPTPAYDEWLRLPAEQRWVRLAAAWWPATRTAGLVGGRDGKGRTLAALGPDLDRGAAPEVRRRVLGLLAAVPAGSAVPAEALLARLAWERPLRGAAGAAPPSGAAQRTPQARGPQPAA